MGCGARPEGDDAWVRVRLRRRRADRLSGAPHTGPGDAEAQRVVERLTVLGSRSSCSPPRQAPREIPRPRRCGASTYIPQAPLQSTSAYNDRLRRARPARPATLPTAAWPRSRARPGRRARSLAAGASGAGPRRRDDPLHPGPCPRRSDHACRPAEGAAAHRGLRRARGSGCAEARLRLVLLPALAGVWLIALPHRSHPHRSGLQLIFDKRSAPLRSGASADRVRPTC